MTTRFLSRLLSLLVILLCMSACYDPKANDYSAYFGGEIINPKSKWVLFYKGDKLIDSLPLDANNRFFVKFDSLTPGLYSFKHDPEYQYVYFDKNDSILVRLNTRNFDESIVFCGRGDQKNNFLIEMYLKTLKDRGKMYSDFELNESAFLKKTDSSYQSWKAFYDVQKKDILWNDEFDQIAQASINYPYFAKRELYPLIHQKRNQQPDYPTLSVGYYDYRKDTDLKTHTDLIYFWPYIQYINALIDNIANKNTNKAYTDPEVFLDKLEIADTLTSNMFLKNKITGNIISRYLIENNLNYKNDKLLQKYYQISSDDKKESEIQKLVTSIKHFTEASHLPEMLLKDDQNQESSSLDIFRGKTIVYFWSKKYENHFFAVHKQLQEFQAKRPDIALIGICLDKNPDEQRSFWNKNKNAISQNIKTYWATDPDKLKEQWVITNITRSILIDENGKISDGFINVFDVVLLKKL